MTIIEEITKIGIVPVIAIDKAEHAAPLAKALIDGGLPCAEVTFRTSAAVESIKAIKKDFPQMLLGAGTVLSVEQVDKAVESGAAFIVSPGLNSKVVSYCIKRDIPVLPGCANPSDVEAAIELGLGVVKFFPAEAAGGLSMIKAMSAPYPSMKFLPTGGVSSKNLVEYLSFGKVAACGGSWMVAKELIAGEEFAKIEKLTKEAVSLMLGFEVSHVGINEADERSAGATADAFQSIFGFARKDGASSIFAGTGIEVMKTPFLGARGHIAIGTNSIERAVYHLERRGAKFDYSTQKLDSSGKIKAIYLNGEIGGFAVHLVQR
ncbi:MAG: bifunctional 4-hydroxy-2-oxoglutarate aldolase/2-dehydro-3-deoxy-phosphogluconate aldolase [Clostridiales bacterium]|jgi:2-dehydro-3-deoxyphosphogluconate aldolase/(4S)-4-hydroxy-2-oxoglutarate aldolase|nr:bifunctional 4-hydroxy-2-oxoglutarate aldolase/2-dehydro-3-deoxy-phosphogluconate aldolase [Clostridiales bacterium]